MKVFIVFVGLLLINISFIVYQADMGRYTQAQTFLKALAEECAAGAALYVDEVEYSKGNLVFDYDEGQKYTSYIIDDSIRRMPLSKNSKISFNVKFQDDNLGYSNSGINEEKIPSVTVKIEAETEDIFRLPFLNVNQVSRTAKYELND